MFLSFLCNYLRDGGESRSQGLGVSRRYNFLARIAYTVSGRPNINLSICAFVGRIAMNLVY